ncbi:unnamed protein product, partial [Ectocarpus sp. 12 AP-2014]
SAHTSVARKHSRVRLFDAEACRFSRRFSRLPSTVFPSGHSQKSRDAGWMETTSFDPYLRGLLEALHTTICLPFPEEMRLRQQSQRRLSFQNRQPPNPHPKRVVCTEKRTQNL